MSTKKTTKTVEIKKTICYTVGMKQIWNALKAYWGGVEHRRCEAILRKNFGGSRMPAWEVLGLNRRGRGLRDYPLEAGRGYPLTGLVKNILKS